MSLHAHPLEPIPELISRIARASFRHQNPGHAAARCAGPDLFPKRGRAAEGRFVTGVGHPHGMRNELVRRISGGK